MFWPHGFGLAVAPGDADGDDDFGDAGDGNDCDGGNSDG